VAPIAHTFLLLHQPKGRARQVDVPFESRIVGFTASTTRWHHRRHVYHSVPRRPLSRVDRERIWEIEQEDSASGDDDDDDDDVATGER
jgi:hypothetical protein